MNRFLVAACALALGTATAFAADDVMANYYGNTVISTGGTFEIHTHYRADHTFDLVGSMGPMSQTFKGTWAPDDKGNVCRTFVGSAPPNAPNPLCTPLTAHKIGDTWTLQSNGSTRTLTLVAGVQ